LLGPCHGSHHASTVTLTNLYFRPNFIFDLNFTN
jgi:hypothetical protein